ncbi:MAG TPA: PadR family transcriptional regulator [Anaerolineae bacterium]
MRLTISPEPALLGFLLDGPVHGYDLYKRVNAHLGLVWAVGMSQMYAIVKTFETRGWVRSRLRSQSTRPSQKVLELTPAGRAAFEEWVHQPAHGLREFRVDFFLRLYFARRAGARFAQELVEGQRAACRDELENLRTRSAEADITEEDLYQLARDFRIKQLTTILKWLDSHRGQLIRPSHSNTPVGPRKRSPPKRASQLGSRGRRPSTVEGPPTGLAGLGRARHWGDEGEGEVFSRENDL